MHIVVAGGTGFLGRPLVARLRAAHDVTVLTRRPHGPGEVGWSPADPSGAWVPVVQQADVVVNLAGAPLAAGRWTSTRKTTIRTSRVTATRALAAAMQRGRARTLISGSAIGIYGDRRDEPLTEASAPGTDFLAGVCRAWEAAALEASGVARVVLLRTGLVLAADGGALSQLARPFRLFAGGRVGSGRQYWSWIHRDDWIDMVGWAIAQPAVSGPLNATAPEPVTNDTFARAIGAALRRPALLPAPAFALRLVLGEMADAMVLSGQRVLPAKAQSLGFTFQYPVLEPALAAIYRPR